MHSNFRMYCALKKCTEFYFADFLPDYYKQLNVSLFFIKHDSRVVCDLTRHPNKK